MKKPTTLPFPQSSNACLTWDSTDDSMIQMASAMGEPIQQAPEKEVKTKASTVEYESAQNSFALKLEFLREAPPSNNSVPPKVLTTAPGSRDIRELEKKKEEESCEWILPVEAGKMGDFPITQLLETRGNLSSPSKTFSQDADNSDLSSAAGLVLQDCATGKLFQDWVPEVLLAADILASMTSQPNFKTEAATTTTKSPFQDRAWQSEMVLGSWTGNPVPNPGLVKGVYESQESKGVVDTKRCDLRRMDQGVSFWKISVASQSPSSRDPRELEKAEEEESWILDKSCWGESPNRGKKSNRKQMAAIYRWIDSVAATISKENRITGSASDAHLSLAADVGFRAPRFHSLRMPICKELPDVSAGEEITGRIRNDDDPKTVCIWDILVLPCWQGRTGRRKYQPAPCTEQSLVDSEETTSPFRQSLTKQNQLISLSSPANISNSASEEKKSRD
ncbi:hypothetical protein ACRRTK_018291 [Alexandromys fortis]